MEKTNKDLDIMHLCQQIDEQAQSNPEFREQLLLNPAEALKEFGGPDLVDRIQAQVVEKGIYRGPDNELSMEELNHVSGGFDLWKWLLDLIPRRNTSCCG